MGLLDDFLTNSNLAPSVSGSIPGKAAPAPELKSSSLPSGAAPEQAAQQAPAAVQQPPAAQPSMLDSFLQSAPKPESFGPGTSPHNAIEESPLSLMERAHLGWVRTPEEQMKVLKNHFEDVQLTKGAEGASFAVKQDGKWYQANPSFEWKYSVPGALAGGLAGLPGGVLGMVAGAGIGGAVAPSLSDSKNRKDLMGDFAQMTGEYGLRAAAGAEGAAQGVIAGTPLGPIGMGAGGLIGGAMGAAGAEGADLAGRQLLPDGTAGKTPYKNADEVQKELIASAVFGATNFAVGKAAEFGAQKIATAFSKSIQTFMDTPSGHESMRKILGMLGAKPEEVEARLMNPSQNAAYDVMRSLDNKEANPIKMGRLDKAQELATDDIHTQVQGLVRKEGREFETILQNPEVRAAKFDLTKSPNPDQMLFQDAMDYLKQNKIVTDDGRPSRTEVLGNGGENAIKYIRNNLQSDSLSYADARAKISSIRTILNSGVENPNVKVVLNKLLDGINNKMTGDLYEIKPELGLTYGSILKKYAGVKSVQEALDTATSGQKRFAFGRKLISDNPNETKAVADSLVNAGVDPNSILKFVQMEGSRNSDSWFTNKQFRIAGVPIPKPGAKVGAAVITGIDQAKNAARQFVKPIQNSDMAQKALPYTNKAVQMMKGLPTQQLRDVLTNPQALEAITGIIRGGAQGQDQQTEELLQKAGVK